MDRIDDAVTRIVAGKCAVGLLDPAHFARDRSGQLGMRSDLLGEFGSAEHRQVAREAVQASLVLLKNEANALPVRAEARLHLTGSGADDIGRQSGGWTITWQGSPGPITVGTTIRQAFSQAMPRDRVSYDKQNIAADADVVLVVASERPYAEGQGDDADLDLDPKDVELVLAAKRANKRTILLLLSGRPMILAKGLAADAIVAGWLPGSEGAGVADVLLGSVPFGGRLPHTWPRSIEQLPINVGDADYDPLFAYGFGLTVDPATGITTPLE
jgi:beta-glucosidase